MATKPRRKWRVEPDRGWAPASFPSENKAYDYVQTVKQQPSGARRITVLVDEGWGAGWERFEVLVRGDGDNVWMDG